MKKQQQIPGITKTATVSESGVNFNVTTNMIKIEV